MVTAGIFPFKENSHGRAGNRTRDLMISSQRLWPLDDEAGLKRRYCNKENLSGFFQWDLPVVKISPEWVTGPEQGKSSGRIATASGSACLGMAFPPFLVKQLYRCDSVVISSFVKTGYTMRRWGWLFGRIGYNITHHYHLYLPPPRNIWL